MRLHLDGDGVNPDRHALHHFLCEAVLAVNTGGQHDPGPRRVVDTVGHTTAGVLPLTGSDGDRGGAIGGPRLLACPHLYFYLIQELHQIEKVRLRRQAAMTGSEELNIYQREHDAVEKGDKIMQGQPCQREKRSFL